MSLLSVAAAQRTLLDKAEPIADREDVALAGADRRVLAQPVEARLTQPPFDASAMDGYALKGAEVQQEGQRFQVIGESAAGHRFEGVVDAGQAVRIFTGAPMPGGADTVLLQEDAETGDDRTIVNRFTPAIGRHVRPRGQDFAEGERVLDEGTVLDFSHLTVAAAMNHPTVSVYRRPRVALLATGDELMPPGSVLGPDQIVASNTFGVGALARRAGADVIDLGIVGDSKDLIAGAIDRARALDVDVLVTLGGASVGDHDLVQSTLKDSGMALDFWRIAMRPGKPLMVGSLGAMHVLGLPGNPVSSLVCAMLFLEPLIAKLAHLPPVRREAMAIAGAPLAENDKRQDYIRASITRESTGQLVATPFGKQDSSMMKIFAQSDCLIIRPPFAPPLSAGLACPVLLLRPEGF